MDAPPVQYVTTSDGCQIAYTVSGAGLPFVLMPPPHSHAQLHWTSIESYVGPWLAGLAERFQLIQYDGRGQGMSSRGVAPDYDMSTFSIDLGAVVDRLQPGPFVLMGHHQAAHAA